MQNPTTEERSELPAIATADLEIIVGGATTATRATYSQQLESYINNARRRAPPVRPTRFYPETPSWMRIPSTPYTPR